MSEPVRVFLAGEGKNELGGLVGDPSYPKENPEPGVLPAMLKRIRPEGWVVGGACEWSKIRKFKARGPVDAETRNVLAVALDAREKNCKIIAFSRDMDNDERRHEAIKRGIEGIKEIDVIGGVAVPTIEGWILALSGERKTETLSPKAAVKLLDKYAIAPKNTADMVNVVEKADLSAIPEDAVTLLSWVRQARTVMERWSSG